MNSPAAARVSILCVPRGRRKACGGILKSLRIGEPITFTITLRGPWRWPRATPDSQRPDRQRAAGIAGRLDKFTVRRDRLRARVRMRH
jgi:hypothetical protein